MTSVLGTVISEILTGSVSAAKTSHLSDIKNPLTKNGIDAIGTSIARQNGTTNGHHADAPICKNGTGKSLENGQALNGKDAKCSLKSDAVTENKENGKIMKMDIVNGVN